MRKVLFTFLLVRGVQVFSCAFHEFPPFGADWYHESIYRILFNSAQQRCIGISYSLNNYSRTFLPEPEFPGEKVLSTLLKEEIMHRSVFYKFLITQRFGCVAALTMTDIRSQALTDDGQVSIRSTSSGQFSVFLTYDVPVFKREKSKTEIKIIGGLQSAGTATNMFYSRLGWLKYQWNRISPRLVAGDYTSAVTFGILPVYQRRDLTIYSGISMRCFTVNKEGFKYGTDMNTFLIVGHRIPLKPEKLRIEPLAGVLYEKGWRDSKTTYCTKDEDTFANGNSFSLVGGIQLSYSTIGTGFSCQVFLKQKDYSEYQLYSTFRSNFFIRIVF